MKFSKKKGIILGLILFCALSLITSLIVYANPGDPDTRTITFTYNLGNTDDPNYNHDYDESISADKKVVTYRWGEWDNERQENMIYNIDVSLVQGTVNNNIIDVTNVETLTKSNHEALSPILQLSLFLSTRPI